MRTNYEFLWLQRNAPLPFSRPGLKYQHCITRNRSHWWPFLRRAVGSVPLTATGICIDPGIYIFPRQIKYSWHSLVTEKLRVLSHDYIVEEGLFLKCGSDDMQRRKGKDRLQASDFSTLQCSHQAPVALKRQVLCSERWLPNSQKSRANVGSQRDRTCVPSR